MSSTLRKSATLWSSSSSAPPPAFAPRNIATLWGSSSSYIVQTWNADGELVHTSPWMNHTDAVALRDATNRKLGMTNAN